ncbi:MAG: histidine phosphatase family protein [Deltaproteobacteria bacterium]|nr:histidine phosphatase family protein [Deltaproteobacteria bacterium]MBW1959973.1 histidine phosphatase family protein [Deltaproteobacteria bacterium]MBW1993799.1 histidine phosphatase family protein [Deltaproteobacteria bacterium]MBW2152195.1 histidine phosphatase family protein [Deltaproteobacteria bacterium]
MRILIVRHGETEWNRIHRFQGRSNVPLNQTGKQQAEALAIALKKEPLSAIYTSPLTRARQTAELIKTYHPAVQLFEEKGFIEMDLGDFDGMFAPDWASEYPQYRKAWMENPSRVKMPGGESLQQVQQRAVGSLGRIIRQHSAGVTILVCTHNFVICGILCHALGMALDRFREIKQGNGALNILRKEGERYRVETLNDLSHFKNLRFFRE